MENIGEIIPLYFPHLMKGRELIVITRYTSAPDKYDELFDKANTRLGLTKEGEKIDSLKGYFMHLRDLVYGPNDSFANNPEELELGYEFLKLPLDEPHLVIDANTRTINTKDFNGLLSVQGDEIAEIVFFEVDRYFDATDLAQMQIAIQWKNKEDEGSTPAFIHIVKYVQEDEKLYFGWPITSDITRTPGAVQFSVRFYERNNDTEEMDYSLVTLPATMNIGASLGAELDEDAMDDPRSIINRRLRNSTTLSQLDLAQPPIFIMPKAEEVIEVDLGATTSHDLIAFAKKSGGGIVNYKWYKSPIDSDIYEGIDVMNDPADLWKPAGTEEKNYIVTKEWNSDISTYYYKKEKDGEISWESLLLVNDNAFATEQKKRGQLYIRVSVLTLNIEPDSSIIGKYRVDARTKSAGSEAYASYGNSVEVNSENYLGDIATPTWIVRGPEQVSIDNKNFPTEKKINETVELMGTNFNSTTSYEWQYSNSEDFSNYESVGFNISQLLNKEGYYKAIATNYKNGVSKNSISNVLVALDKIQAWSLSVSGDILDGYTATIDRELDIKESEVVYEWYDALDNTATTPIAFGAHYTVDENSPQGLYVKATINKGSLYSESKTSEKFFVD